MHEFFSGKGQSWKTPRNRNGRRRKAIIFVVHKHDVFPAKTNFLESSNFKKHIGPGEGGGEDYTSGVIRQRLKT
jgi:hypothetical protein